MTIRDYVQKHYPDAIDKDCDGGVGGCPDEFPELAGYELHPDGCSVEDDCNVCWSQEYLEPKQKKKFDPSAIFTALAVLMTVAGIVAVVCGDSDTVYHCCVMGMLYVIAARVWRDKP